jgi:Na+-translocating ferredoxin:NAD+ oxidoreductase RnfA subunit
MVASFPFFWWIVIFAFWVIFLTLTMTIARSKGHSPLLWGLLAVFFPLITVIIVLVLPDRTRAVQ